MLGAEAPMKSSMRMALTALIAVVILSVVSVVFLPRSATIQRSVVIEAPPERVYGLVVDLEAYQRWSPFAAADPTMQVTYGPRTTGVGATYSWSGESSGTGSLTVLEAEPPRRIVNALVFGGAGGGTATWTFEREGTGTRVTWSVATEAEGLTGGVFALMANSVIGPSFEDGLARLKVLSEEAE